MISPDYSVYAGAIVQAPKGRILCQLRDNTPGIVCPMMWTCSPGGHVEVGESPRDAVVRELWEEFELSVTGPIHLMTHQMNEGELQGLYHSYLIYLPILLDNVKCKEGKGAEFVPIKQAMMLPQHPVSLIFLKYYMQTEAIDATHYSSRHSQS